MKKSLRNTKKQEKLSTAIDNSKKVKCDTCNGDMPKARKDLGYKVCTKCSTVAPYGHIHILSSKTADTIQILPADVAERANRYTKRTGFGVLKIMADKKY